VVLGFPADDQGPSAGTIQPVLRNQIDKNEQFRRGINQQQASWTSLLHHLPICHPPLLLQ
jgi:hypothetical protein